jgi:hypothetical protein
METRKPDQTARTLPQALFRQRHRQARLGQLCTLAASVRRTEYEWFLSDVYDLRHPRVGCNRHLSRRTFDTLQGKLTVESGVAVRVVNR